MSLVTSVTDGIRTWIDDNPSQKMYGTLELLGSISAYGIGEQLYPGLGGVLAVPIVLDAASRLIFSEGPFDKDIRYGWEYGFRKSVEIWEKYLELATYADRKFPDRPRFTDYDPSDHF